MVMSDWRMEVLMEMGEMLTNAEKPDEDTADLAEKPHDFLGDGADTTDFDEQKTPTEALVCW